MSDKSLDSRIEQALERIKNGNGNMRVPAEQSDPDLVLFDCREEIAALRRQLAESTELCVKLEADLDEADKDVMKLRAERDALQARLRKLSAEHECLECARPLLDCECDYS